MSLDLNLIRTSIGVNGERKKKKVNLADSLRSSLNIKDAPQTRPRVIESPETPTLVMAEPQVQPTLSVQKPVSDDIKSAMRKVISEKTGVRKEEPKLKVTGAEPTIKPKESFLDKTLGVIEKIPIISQIDKEGTAVGREFSKAVLEFKAKDKTPVTFEQFREEIEYRPERATKSALAGFFKETLPKTALIVSKAINENAPNLFGKDSPIGENQLVTNYKEKLNEKVDTLIDNIDDRSKERFKKLKISENAGLFDPTRFAYGVTSGGSSLLLAIGIGSITKNPSAAAGVLSVIESSDTYQAVRKDGKSPKEALAIAGAEGVGTFYLEKLGMESLFKTYKGGGIASASIKSVTETLQESGQTVWQNLVAKYGYDEARDIFEGLNETIIYTLPLGFLSGGAIDMFSQTQLNDSTQLKLNPKVAKTIIQDTQKQLAGDIADARPELANNLNTVDVNAVDSWGDLYTKMTDAVADPVAKQTIENHLKTRWQAYISEPEIAKQVMGEEFIETIVQEVESKTGIKDPGMGDLIMKVRDLTTTEVDKFREEVDEDEVKLQAPPLEKVMQKAEPQPSQTAKPVSVADQARESLGVKKVVTDKVDILTQEAKKYKSADEFIQKQGIKVYRGSDVTDIDITKGSDQGISVTTDKLIARNFIEGKGGIGEAILPKNARILKDSSIPKNLKDAYSDEAIKLMSPSNFSAELQNIVKSRQQDIVKYARTNGYDAVEFLFEDELRIIKPNILKTKSQLTEIWNEANQADDPKIKPNVQEKQEIKVPAQEEARLQEKIKEGETKIEPVETIKTTKTVEVPKKQLPIKSEGKRKVSRLEARVKNALGDMTDSQIDNIGLATYNEINKADQIKRASEYVSQNQAEALAVLKGQREAPEGLLRNSILVAMSQSASNNVELGLKLASLFATRAGQEIGILSEIDKDSPIKLMDEIIKIREKTVKKRLKGKNEQKAKNEIKQSLKNKVAKPNKVTSWESLIDDIIC